MKDNLTLIMTSWLSILLFTFHFADDIVRGMEKGDLANYAGVLIVSLWLYATLELADRRSGLIIMLLFSAGAAAMPLIHMRGAGLVGGRIANSSGVFFWVWTIISLGTAGLVSLVLAARALWALQRARATREA